MLSQNLRFFRYAGIGLCLAVFFGLLVFPVLQGSAAGNVADKEDPAPTGRSPIAYRPVDRMAKVIGDCSPTGQLLREFKAKGDPLAPSATLCVNGSHTAGDPTLDRPSTQAASPGIVAGCPLTGSQVRYDFYSFNLTGCAAFPTEVTMTLCGPAGCLPIAGTDTQLFLYRAVSAGDPLTANGGLSGVFNPAAPCTNARAAHNDLNGGASSNPGTGTTCNQVNTANCLGACSVTTVSGFRRQLGNGRFTLVVMGSGPGDLGNYNLFLDAPAAGCSVALAPSAANAEIGGRVVTQNGRAIGKATLTITGGNLPSAVIAKTNPFGYYNFPNLEGGLTYTVTVSAKGYTFTTPTRIISLQDAVNDADFISTE